MMHFVNNWDHLLLLHLHLVQFWRGGRGCHLSFHAFRLASQMILQKKKLLNLVHGFDVQWCVNEELGTCLSLHFSKYIVKFWITILPREAKSIILLKLLQIVPINAFVLDPSPLSAYASVSLSEIDKDTIYWNRAIALAGLWSQSSNHVQLMFPPSAYQKKVVVLALLHCVG